MDNGLWLGNQYVHCLPEGALPAWGRLPALSTGTWDAPAIREQWLLGAWVGAGKAQAALGSETLTPGILVARHQGHTELSEPSLPLRPAAREAFLVDTLRPCRKSELHTGRRWVLGLDYLIPGGMGGGQSPAKVTCVKSLCFFLPEMTQLFCST